MASRMGRRWGVLTGAGALVLGVGFAACGGDVGSDGPDSAAPDSGAALAPTYAEGDDTGTVQLPVLTECPQSWDTVARAARRSGPPVTEFSAPARLTDVPEFHDCQKFVMSDNTYGPLIAIFAVPELGWMNEYLDSIQARTNLPRSRRAKFTRSLEDRDTTSAPNPPLGGAATVAGSSAGNANDTHAAGVAALIINFGDAYEDGQFKIPHGLNCLYMWRAGGWKAAILPVPDERLCVAPRAMAAFTNTGLKVHEDRPSAKQSDYPDVARWDHDVRSGKQYIGIKCGASWCEIGAGNFASSQANTGNFGAAGPRKVARIKGWYDEQRLAVVLAGGVASPSRLKGTIVPHHTIDTLRREHFDTVWRTVAYIALSGGTVGSAEYKYYRDKLNLHRAPLGNDLEALNKIALCYGSREKCKVEPADKPACGIPAGEFGTRNAWWGRITNIAGGHVYKCINEEDHSNMGPNFHVVGTARWRWLLNDETTWARCLEGCCEVDAISET